MQGCCLMKVCSVLFTIGIYTGSHLAAAQCDAGWQPFNNFCYRASEFSSEIFMSWTDSRLFCTSEGGELVSILDDLENSFVEFLIGESNVATEFYIGFNFLGSEWSWSDGSSVDFTNWGSGQPDTEDGTKNCSYIDADRSGEWYLENCGRDVGFGFVCKKPVDFDGTNTVPPTDLVRSYCPDGYFSVDEGNKCYRIFLNDEGVDDGIALSFQGARDFCRAQPGVKPDLASINSIQEQAAISARLNGQYWPVWTGYYYDSNSGIWYWTDQSTATFENWAPNEPTNIDNYCIEMYVHSDYVGLWASISCFDNRGYICQTYKDADNPVVTPPMTPPNSCSAEWTPYLNGCYQAIPTLQRTWQEAEDDCVTQGGHLVSMVNAEENAAVMYIFSTATNISSRVWIGLSQDLSDSEYKWSDGLPVVYTNYEVGSPNDEGCVALEYNLQWRGYDCTTELNYVCKQTTGDMPTTPAPVEGSCPGEDWVEWGRYCYLFTPFQTIYQAAEMTCEQEDAHLVSIHSHIENIFVNDGMLDVGVEDNGWIGLYKLESEGLEALRWTDDSPLDFTYWAMGEPNNPLSEHCTEIYAQPGTEYFTGLWNNNLCTYERGFACKYDKGVPPPTGNVTVPQPQYYLTHNASFSSSTGADFTPQCTQAYSVQMNSKAQSLLGDVNSKIGVELCVGVTTQQISVVYVTCPFSTVGSQGVTDVVYVITTSPDLTLSSTHACIEEVSTYLALYSNWGEPVLDPEAGCPEVDFDGSSFNEVDNNYLCLGQGKYNTPDRSALDEAFLNYGVFHVGLFQSDDGSIITNECTTRYTGAFTARALGMAAQVNTEIQSGSLCGGQEVTINNVSPLFLTSAENQGSTNQRYILEPGSGLSFTGVTACATEVSQYLADHANWGSPILDPIEGCPALVFDPEMFQETEQEWICSTQDTVQRRAGRKMKSAQEALKESVKMQEETAKQSVKEPVKTVKEPVKIVKEPVKIVKEPVKVVNEPVKIVKEPVKIVKEPVKIVKEPVKTVKEPVKIVQDPVKEAEVKLSKHIVISAEQQKVSDKDSSKHKKILKTLLRKH